MSQPGVSKPTVSQQPDKRDWIPVIVGAVAVVLGGGILASIYNSFISYVTAPYVGILIKPDGKHNGNNTSILFENTGGAAAKHVKLMVKTPEEIIRYDNFSTENITLRKVTPRLLEGNMQRFVQGAGSLVNINLTIKAKPNINYTKGYAAFVTYDQGSNTEAFPLNPPNRIYYIIVLILYIPTTILVIFFYRGFIYRMRVRKLEDMIRFRHDMFSFESLDASREKADYYYTDGKLRKADYDRLVKMIEERKKAIEKYRFEIQTKKDTSEGKPITDEK
jgi:hypothetical protein